MRVADIMSTSLALATPETTIHEAARLMRDRNIGCLPVVNNLAHPVLTGILTDRDIVVRGLAEQFDGDAHVRHVMTRSPLRTIRADSEVHDILAIMERYQIRRLPVVANDGRVVGIVSQGDLALSLGPMEPAAIEALLERVSAPAWTIPLPNGLARGGADANR